MDKHEANYLQLYAGCDRQEGQKTTGFVWFGVVLVFGGGCRKKPQAFMVKWLHLCSRSWMFRVRKQSGRWDLLNHPFGPGSSSHLQVKSVTLQRAALCTPYSQSKLLLTQIVSLQSTKLFMWDQCDTRAMFSLSIMGYSVATHRTKLICLSHWWTATIDPGAVELWPQSILGPQVPDHGQMLSSCQACSHSSFTRQPHGWELGRDQACSFKADFNSSWT